MDKILSDADKEDNKSLEGPESSMASITDIEPSVEPAVRNELIEIEPDKVESTIESRVVIPSKGTHRTITVVLLSLEASSLNEGGDVTMLLCNYCTGFCYCLLVYVDVMICNVCVM